MSVFDLNTTAAPTAITGALENPTGVAVDKRQALRSRLLSHFKITNTGLGYRMLTPATVDAGKLETVLAAGTRAVRETDYYFARSYRGRGSWAAKNLDEVSPER